MPGLLPGGRLPTASGGAAADARQRAAHRRKV